MRSRVRQTSFNAVANVKDNEKKNSFFLRLWLMFEILNSAETTLVHDKKTEKSCVNERCV